MNFIYKNNKQIKECLLSIIKKEKITYQELGDMLNTSHQNAYKMVNKNSYKFDDVSKICNKLGYEMIVTICKKDDKTVMSEGDIFVKAIQESIDELYGIMETIQGENKRILKHINDVATKE